MLQNVGPLILPMSVLTGSLSSTEEQTLGDVILESQLPILPSPMVIMIICAHGYP